MRKRLSRKRILRPSAVVLVMVFLACLGERAEVPMVAGGVEEELMSRASTIPAARR